MKIFDNTVFDTKTFWKALFAFLAIMALQMVSRGEAYAVLVLFAFGAVFAQRATSIVFWLLVSETLIIGNAFFMPKGFFFFFAQRLLLLVAGLFALVQISRGRTNPMLSPFRGMMPYIVYMALVACMGWNPLISYLKIFLFSVVYLAYYCLTGLVAKSHSLNVRQIRGVILAIVSVLVFGSLALIPFPAISQLSAEEYEQAIRSGREVVSLFKGMTNQSQALGPTMAFIFTFVFVDLVVNIRKMNALYLAVLIVAPYLLYLSSSRAGMLTLLMGILVASFCVMKMRGIGMRWRGKVKAALFGIGVLMFIAVIALPGLRESVIKFAMKYDRSGEFSSEGAMATRQGLIDRQLETFKKSPLFGNGFQVSEALQHRKVRTWMNLLSAPVEKGVWITAVLEEGGVCGFVLLVGFYIALGLTLLNRGAYTGLTMLCALLTSNMGEFTMFSMSGLGGFLWLLVFVGIMMDAARQRQDTAPRMPPHPFYRPLP